MTGRRKADKPGGIPAGTLADVLADGVADIEPEDVEAAEAFDSFAGEAGEQSYALLYTRDEKGHLEYLDKLADVESWNTENIAATYGGGVFTVQTWLKPKVHYRTFTVRVNKRVKPKTAPEPATVGTAHPGPAQTELIAMLARMEGKMEGLLEGLRVTGAGQQGNALSSFKEMAETLGAMIGLRKEAAPTSPLAQVKELAETMNVLKGLQGEGGGGGDGEGSFPWGKLIDKAEPLISMAVEQAGKSPVALPATPAATPKLPGAKPTPTAEPAPMWKMLVAREIPQLIDHAAKNRDPKLWADVYAEQLAERLPVTTYTALQDRARAPEAVSEAWSIAVQNFPQLQPYEQWARDFLSALRDALLDEGEPEVTDAEPAEPETQGLG